jgi:hypothetical protein
MKKKCKNATTKKCENATKIPKLKKRYNSN